jgi:hypothetical protein
VSCADAAPDIMVIAIAKADFHIRAPVFSTIGKPDMTAVTRIVGR